MPGFDITTLSGAIASSKLRAEDLTRECIRRIERENGRLRAVIAVDPDAVDQARALDRERERQGVRGPLHGIPILVKDNIEAAGRLPTTAGSLALASNVTGRDAPAVARLRAAGAVILGKANLSEWANFRSTMSVSGWSAVGGQCVNAHDPARSPCGSSSGSAVAVASGMVPAAIGTETDGSIVCPSSINGIVGLKPTVGLVDRTGIVPISQTQDTAGPMTSTVADAALLLSAMTPHADNFASGLDTLAGELPLTGIRAGAVRGVGRFHPQCEPLFERALSRLRGLGATIVTGLELSLPQGYREASLTVLLYEFKRGINAYLQSVSSELDLDGLIRFNREHADAEMRFFGQELFEQAAAHDDAEVYRHALALIGTATRENGIDRVLRSERLDALVSTTSGPAWTIDDVNGDRSVGSCSTFAAAAGYPHITVPMGLVRGLPIGLSVYGTRFSEAKLLAIAHAFERHSRRAN
jgi:amidase